MADSLHPAGTRPGRARGAGSFALLLALSVGLAPGAARPDCSEEAPSTTAKRPDDLGQMLSSLGEWVELPRHGKAWRPCGVESDWRPYFRGSWTWTEEGWFWVSDEPWGWATYHYGRWFFDRAFGWVWLPGKVWAPAWVTWRWNDEVIGWAPLAPRGVPYSAFWTFVPASRFVGERVEAMAIPAPRVPALLLKTRLPASPAHARRDPPPSARRREERAGAAPRGASDGPGGERYASRGPGEALRGHLE